MKNTEVEFNGSKFWISRSIATVVYVYTHIDGQLHILANKRGPGLPNNVGKWNCPSGFLDYDETIKACAAREVFEETGCNISAVSLTLEEIDDNPNRRSQVVLFRYSTLVPFDSTSPLTTEHAEPDEVEEVKWIPISDIEKYTWVSQIHKSKIYEFQDHLPPF